MGSRWSGAGKEGGTTTEKWPRGPHATTLFCPSDAGGAGISDLMGTSTAAPRSPEMSFLSRVALGIPGCGVFPVLF